MITNNVSSTSWKDELNINERGRFISRLGNALQLLSPNTPHTTIFSAAKQLESSIYDSSIDKNQYISAHLKKLQQIKIRHQTQSQNGKSTLTLNGNQFLPESLMIEQQISSMQQQPSPQIQSSVQPVENNSLFGNQQQPAHFGTCMPQESLRQTGSSQVQTTLSQPQPSSLQESVSQTPLGTTNGSSTSGINMMNNAGPRQQQQEPFDRLQSNTTDANMNMSPRDLQMFLSHQMSMQTNNQTLSVSPQQGTPQFNNTSVDHTPNFMNLNLSQNVTQDLLPPETIQSNQYQNDLMSQQLIDPEAVIQYLQQQQPPPQAQNSVQQQVMAEQQAQKKPQTKAHKRAQTKQKAQTKTLAQNNFQASQLLFQQQPQTHHQSTHNQPQQHQAYLQTQQQQSHLQSQNSQLQMEQNAKTQPQDQTPLHPLAYSQNQAQSLQQFQAQYVKGQLSQTELQKRYETINTLCRLDKGLRNSKAKPEFVEGLSDEEKAAIRKTVEEIMPLYGKLNSLLPLFLSLTSNIEATKRLLYLKHIFEDQLIAQQQDQYTISLQHINSLQHQMMAYFSFVIKNVSPQGYQQSKQFSNPQQPSPAQQSSNIQHLSTAQQLETQQYQQIQQLHAQKRPKVQQQAAVSHSNNTRMTFAQNNQPTNDSPLMNSSEKKNMKRASIDLQLPVNKKQKMTSSKIPSSLDTTQMPQQPLAVQNTLLKSSPLSPMPCTLGKKRGSVDYSTAKQKLNTSNGPAKVSSQPSTAADLTQTHARNESAEAPISDAIVAQRQAQALLLRQSAVSSGIPLEIVNILPPYALQCCWVLQQNAQNQIPLTSSQRQQLHDSLNEKIAVARLVLNQKTEDFHLKEASSLEDEKSSIQKPYMTSGSPTSKIMQDSSTLQSHATVRQASQSLSMSSQSAPSITPQLTPPQVQSNRFPTPSTQMTPPQVQTNKPTPTMPTPPQIQANHLPTQKIPSPRLTPGKALRQSVMNDQSPLLYQNNMQDEIDRLFSYSAQAHTHNISQSEENPHNTLLFEPFPIGDSDDEKNPALEEAVVDTWYENGMETGVPEINDIFNGFLFEDPSQQPFISI
ncbi:hypothetical protein BY458DRAFT_492547 [Sporodiniella umbellata]|nr:hypothetical protein BY458DRAFT_492547 [Sporodiniella umbellata]